MITRHILVNKLSAYLNHQLTLHELVDWAENAMMEEEFDPKDFETIRYVISRLGLADVKEFGLSWEDCEDYLKRLGFHAEVEVKQTD